MGVVQRGFCFVHGASAARCVTLLPLHLALMLPESWLGILQLLGQGGEAGDTTWISMKPASGEGG